jgi:hypothetical protein
VLITAGPQDLETFARHRHQAHQEALNQGHQPVVRTLTIPDQGAQESYDRDCHPHRIHNCGKPRVVINHRKADLSATATFFISNNLNGQAHGLTRLRRHRWPVEGYPEEGQADGLTQDQVRDFQALYRPIALVAVPDS